MVGPVDVVKSGQIGAVHHVVGGGVVAVSAHDNTGVAGGTGLGDQVGADDVIVEGRIHELHAGVHHGGKLVGVVLHIHGSGGLHGGYFHAVGLAGGGEGVIQALGISISGAVDHAHLVITGLLGVSGGDGALEAVSVAGAEDEVILSGDGVGGGGGGDEADLLLVGGAGDGAGAAGGDGADDQAHALRHQGVESVQALGGVILVIGVDDLQLTAQQAAGGVDLLHGQGRAGGDGGAVGGQIAGVGRDGTDQDGLIAAPGRGGGLTAGCGCAASAAAGGQGSCQGQSQQNAQKTLSFHNDSSLKHAVFS